MTHNGSKVKFQVFVTVFVTFFNTLILGPDLPLYLDGFSVVNFEDTLIVIGGSYRQSTFKYSKSLYKLACEGLTCTWNEMSQKFTVGRENFVAIMVSDDYCSNSK